jgi:hypothetical protein
MTTGDQDAKILTDISGHKNRGQVPRDRVSQMSEDMVLMYECYDSVW